ncbi:MFS transporter [Streptomyces palmae]|uniref:MFS transporter n=1 Tax=Streptomyces palmae TaxID=1701085 RepID=A0A4Z0FWM3_9ACTN|nr:MFS transporter [Streptomyces palmae]
MPRSVWLLLVARMINRLGAFSLSFLTVLISTSHGADEATAGLVAAAFGIATIPSRLAGGRLADRLGRRRTIVLGMAGCALAQLGIAAADSLTAVVVFAVLLGLVFELYEPPSQAMIADAVGATERVRAFGLLNAALAAGGMGAGLLATALGRWDLRWLFVADALSCLLCAILIHAVLPADRPDRIGRQRDDAPEQTAIRPWRDRALLAQLAFGTGYALVSLQTTMSLPLALAHRGLQPADAGLLFTVSALTIVSAQPALRQRHLAALSAPAALALGYGLVGAGLLGYAAAHTLPACVLATVVWSAGDLLVLARAYARVTDLAPPDAIGRYLAVYGVSWGIATVAAPLAGTQILQHAGPTALWTSMAALCLLLAACQPLTGARVPAGPRPFPSGVDGGGPSAGRSVLPGSCGAEDAG